MADTTCTSHWAKSKHGDCIHAMAAGWITSDDLCPPCTARFMAALDAAVPGLSWAGHRPLPISRRRESHE